MSNLKMPEVDEATLSRRKQIAGELRRIVPGEGVIDEAEEMRAYAKADQKLSQVHEPLIVAGGQRVKLWRDLPDILAPREVLMRGLGDATVNDILYYYDRLIGYHYPQTLVLLPGNSEFHIRDGKSAEELFDSIVTLAEVDAKVNPKSRAAPWFILKPKHGSMGMGVRVVGDAEPRVAEAAE